MMLFRPGELLLDYVLCLNYDWINEWLATQPDDWVNVGMNVIKLNWTDWINQILYLNLS